MLLICVLKQNLQLLLDFCDKFLIFCIRQINFAGIHLEHAAVVGTIDILRGEVEMQVAQLVAIGTVVDLLGIEGTLHGAGCLGDIGHKVVALLVVQLVQVVHVAIVGNEATAAIGLLLEEEET